LGSGLLPCACSAAVAKPNGLTSIIVSRNSVVVFLIIASSLFFLGSWQKRAEMARMDHVVLRSFCNMRARLTDSRRPEKQNNYLLIYKGFFTDTRSERPPHEGLKDGYASPLMK